MELQLCKKSIRYFMDVIQRKLWIMKELAFGSFQIWNLPIANPSVKLCRPSPIITMYATAEKLPGTSCEWPWSCSVSVPLSSVPGSLLWSCGCFSADPTEPFEAVALLLMLEALSLVERLDWALPLMERREPFLEPGCFLCFFSFLETGGGYKGTKFNSVVQTTQ